MSVFARSLSKGYVFTAARCTTCPISLRDAKIKILELGRETAKVKESMLRSALQDLQCFGWKNKAVM